ncbi:ATP phosphoribosyltransferase regulatory subunit [Patescibacteria group bacterium]|nr:ATP phosphoribosyltransferase regulatory subunit [Patescibacteria group bacterium]
MDEKTKPEAKLSTEAYKGVRDFYPEDMAIQNYIFDTWKKVSKDAGFVEYSASILEPAELYRAKSGEELVNEQMFTFTDKGDREVALRPEMTPSFARMVAAKRKSLKFPLKWFSIPNLFRYERPQRGRKREHWQLNCDIVGIADLNADAEIISLAYKIMKAFGAKNEEFQICINDRVLLNEKFNSPELIKLLDRKEKMEPAEFSQKWMEISGKEYDDNIEPNETIKELLNKLESEGVKNVIFAPTVTRGFDYYTGMVFEVFDTHPDNKRSLFGGGRYDNLLEIFGVEPVPTVGFGMGDITMRDFLETHSLPTCEK